MVLRVALTPLAAIYGAVMALRRYAYRRGWIASVRLTGPVISVGNLALGGRGKTPIVAWIAGMLRDNGFPVSILSRGYRGSYEGDALLVSDGKEVLAGADEAGDEPVMLARRLHDVYVAVARRRVNAGLLVEKRFGPCVHVLDDGFQHLQLVRDLDLVCLDVADARDRPLPAGSLRERSSALRYADAALITGTRQGAGSSEPLSGMGREHVFTTRRRSSGFFTVEGQSAAAPNRPLLLAAIARPQRFFEDVSTIVTEVAARVAFRDHHRFRAREIDRIARLAERSRADAIVTTDKDLARMRAIPALGVPLLAYRTGVEIDDDERFRALLLDTARSLWSSRGTIREDLKK
ncbi:MAG: tetraacyldisaccharide 4'-kinase [Vicinamibacteria bacterium]|nr:tetraacyldisaccharide 4'-kinase [Vicinamibacteria bacterium]